MTAIKLAGLSRQSLPAGFLVIAVVFGIIFAVSVAKAEAFTSSKAAGASEDEICEAQHMSSLA